MDLKIHDLEYLFFRTIRRFRGRVVRAYQKGTLSNVKILRLVAVFVLAVSVVKSSRSEVSVVVAERGGEGRVLAAPTVTPIPTPYPKRRPQSPDLEAILARSVLVVDATTSAILYEKEPSLKLPVASLTKMMTALVVLEDSPVAETVSVKSDCLKFNGGSMMGLKEGERISVENLLYGLLLPSAADSACVLALRNGRTGEEFVAKMNDKAKALGMSETVFVNFTGLDEAGSGNLSTAGDLLKLVLSVWRDPLFRTIAGTSRTVVTSADGSVAHVLANTNELLGTFPGTLGIKTGITDQAGGCLAFAYTREERELIGVILGSSEKGRFEEAKKIADWVFRVYQW